MSVNTTSVDDALTPEDRAALERILGLLETRRGLKISPRKAGRVLRRLYKRLRGLAIESLSEYAEHLTQDDAELAELADELQLPAARILRDPRLYAGLTAALPQWLSGVETPQVWVPACRSGHELAALALVLAQALPDRLPRLRLYGTDADAEALTAARQGRLAPEDGKALPASLREWVESTEDGGLQLVEALRAGCQFLPLELLDPPPFTELDLICCRSVLAGLELRAQRQLLEHFHAALAPHGRLLVAPDEEGLMHPDLFIKLPPGEAHEVPAVFRRIERRRRAAAPSAPRPAALLQEPLARSLFELASDPMLLVDATGQVLAANPAFVTRADRPLPALLGLAVDELLGDGDAADPALTGWWLDPESVSGGRLLGGVLGPVRVTTRRIEPTLWLLSCAILDETESLRRALALEREWTRAVGGMIREAVVTVDPQGQIVTYSASAERLVGWRVEEALGQPAERILPLVDAAGTPVDWQETLKPDAEPARWDSCLLLKREGRRVNVRLDATPLALSSGERGAVLILSDITVFTLLTEELAYRAAHDPLTGLLSRDELERRLANALAEARRSRLTHVFAYLDLDQFKVINDTLGHYAGDDLLRQFASLLRSRLRGVDVVGRLGGDEFGVLLHAVDLEEGYRLMEAIHLAARDFRFQWEGQSYGTTLSIGLAPIDHTTTSTARVLSEADSACFAAKDAGRDRIHTAGANDEVSRRQGEMGMVARINRALDLNLFELHFEDVVRCKRPDQVVYRELLVRMRDQDTPGKLVSPGLFIPAAERYFLMGAIDRWVVNAAFAGVAQRPVDGVLYAINLSGLSVNDEKFLSFVLSRFDHFGLAPEQICFEITETAAISHLKEARRFIERLADVGCSFALDDFGVGMSSFSYLKNLPVTYLKIDGSFVRAMPHSKVDRGMVEAINRIGHEMGLKTIAEHVEDTRLLADLSAIGVDYAQGWGIARGKPFQRLLEPPG